MIPKLEYITARGDILKLTGNEKFKLVDPEGITTANVDLSTSTVASMDGDLVNNMQTTPRGIVLPLVIESGVEETKRYIFKYIKPKQKAILRMTQNNRVTQIVGIVEAIDMPRYNNPVIMQVTIYCSQPYWEDVEFVVQEISEIINLHYFTVAEPKDEEDMLYFTDEGIPMGEYDSNRTKVFENNGDVAVGMEIRIIALGNVKNPMIFNSEGKFFGINIEMESGNEIIVTTEKGKKSVTMNGSNIISKVMRGSSWLNLEVGENEFTIDSEDGTESQMYFNVLYKQKYV